MYMYVGLCDVQYFVVTTLLYGCDMSTWFLNEYMNE